MRTKKSATLAAVMSMFVCSLNSGSNANCYYIGNQDEAILVDGGLSCRETEKRLKRQGLSIRNVRAIFVSHEHADHIYGIPGLSKKHRLPVYITRPTYCQAPLEVDEKLIVDLHVYQPVSIGNLNVTAFPKLHDACDPVNFVVECASVKVGVFTDMGSACDHVVRNFAECHAAFLEANYDDAMLSRGRYPASLKKRIRGERGHMSNDQAVELVLTHKPPFMSHLFLSHLSRNNNNPKLVQNTFQRIAGDTQIVIASRIRESQVYHIRNTEGRRLYPRQDRRRAPQLQLSLFS